MSTAPRYSPSWSSGAFITRQVPVPDVPTAFEQLVLRHGLEKRPDLWAFNRHVVQFAKRNRNLRYVPESLLKELGLAMPEGLED